MPSFFQSSEQFTKQALGLYAFQFETNPIFRSFCDLTSRHPAECNNIETIPYLPISCFKTHRVQSETNDYAHVFESSGTGGQTSSHFVNDIKLYEQSFTTCFTHFYGDPSQYAVIGLLPGYLERPNSSLVYMVQKLIELSKNQDSGFYLDQFDSLHQLLFQRAKQNKKTLLIGVSFALMDFAEQFSCSLPQTVVIETGGMKGKRKELIREELHLFLKHKLGVQTVHSEYGMTELLSQAYAKKNGLFRSPEWMKVLVRNPNDPYDVKEAGTGCLNVIDLANKNSCAFIATDDLGTVYPDGSFKVLGRYDSADVRGCNLMVS